MAPVMPIQLLIMFVMIRPATVMGGHMAGGYLSAMTASVLVVMLWAVFAIMVGTAVLLLIREDADAESH